MANFATIDFKGTTSTKAKNLAREATVNYLFEVLKEALGEENVSMVGASEISIAVGTRADSDGFDHEVNVNIAPTAKEPEDRATSKNVYEAYDRLGEAEEYAKDKAKKEAEKKKKEEAKEKAKKKLEEKKAKDAAEKEKRIREKMAAKAEVEVEVEVDEDEDEEVNETAEDVTTDETTDTTDTTGGDETDEDETADEE